MDVIHHHRLASSSTSSTGGTETTTWVPTGMPTTMAPSTAPPVLVTSNDSEIIRGTLRIYGSVYLVLFVIFCYVRKKFPKLYNLRGWVTELKCPLALNQSYGWVDWCWKVFQIHDDDLLTNCGMDALCFLRSLRLGTKLAAIGCFNALWLIPVYYTARGLEETNNGNDQDRFLLISVANVPLGSHRFAAVVIAAYIMVGSTLHLLSKEYDWYTKYRHKFLTQKVPRNYAIYVSGIPPELRSDFALRGFFRNTVEAYVAMNIPKLEAKVARRKLIVQRLEHAMAEEKQTGVVRTHRTFKIKNATPRNLTRVSESVESIQTYEGELQKLNRSISLEVGRIRNSNNYLRRHLTKSKADSDILRGRVLTPCDQALLEAVNAAAESGDRPVVVNGNPLLPSSTSLPSSSSLSPIVEGQGTTLFHDTQLQQDTNGGTLSSSEEARDVDTASWPRHGNDQITIRKGMVTPVIPEDGSDEDDDAVDDGDNSQQHLSRNSDITLTFDPLGETHHEDNLNQHEDIHEDDVEDGDEPSTKDRERDEEGQGQSTDPLKENSTPTGSASEMEMYDSGQNQLLQLSRVSDRDKGTKEGSSEVPNLDSCQNDDKEQNNDNNNNNNHNESYDEENPATLAMEFPSVDLSDDEYETIEEKKTNSSVGMDKAEKYTPSDAMQCLPSTNVVISAGELDLEVVDKTANDDANVLVEHDSLQHHDGHDIPLRNRGQFRLGPNTQDDKTTKIGSALSKRSSGGSSFSLSNVFSSLKQRSFGRRTKYARSSTTMSNVSLNAVTDGVKNVLDFGVNGALSAAVEAKKVASYGLSTLQSAPETARSTLSQNAAAIAPILLNNGEASPREAGFVVFRDLYTTQAALQMLHHPESTSMLVEDAPSPKEIFWLNVGLPHSARRTGSVLSLAATCTLCLFWSFPVAFISSLTSVNSLKENLPRLGALIDEYPAMEMFLALIAPLMLLILNDTLLPFILKWFAQWEGHISGPRLEASLFRKLSVFAIVQTFFVSTISGSFTSELANMINNPEDIVDFLANSLPAQSSYFIQIVLISTFLMQGIDLLRIVPLGYALVRRFVGPNLTAKERRRKWKFIYSLEKPPAFQHAEVFSQIVLFYVVIFVYAPISPITCVFLLGCFLILESGYRYHFIHNYPTYHDSGGRIWKGLILVLMFSMVIGQLTLIGLLLLNQAFYSVPALAPLLAITILFMILVHPKRIRVSTYLPAIECLEADKPPPGHTKSFDDLEFLKNQYLQPALTTPWLFPEDDSE